LWHLASLDAPTVALVWALSFTWAAGAHLLPQAAAIITLGVWAVYVGDRLLDARSSLRHHTEHRLRERHYFHWRHRRLFLPFTFAAVAATAILLLACIPVAARERDSVLALASLAYFARVHSNGLSTARHTRSLFPPLVTKELLVGVLFAAGCAMPAIGASWGAPMAQRCALLGTVLFFAMLAWLNCYAIECWESVARSRSYERLGAGPGLVRIAFGLAAMGMVGALACYAHPRFALLLAAGATSALLIALLHRLRPRLAPVTLRAGADLVLLTPALAVFIAWLVAGPLAGPPQ
jgi:hypothetical protein